MFVKVRSRAQTTAEALRASAERQLISIELWGEQQGQVLKDPVLLARTRARYRPDRDPVLLGAVAAAKSEGRMLVMDDVFRLAGGCDGSEAIEIVQALWRLDPPVVSIRHGASFMGFKAETIKKEIIRCTWEFSAAKRSGQESCRRSRPLAASAGTEGTSQGGKGPKADR